MARPGVKTNKGRPAAMRAPAGVVPAVAGAAPVEKVKRPPFNPVRFWGEVRQEARKITCTSWRETWITSVMVFIMVAITGIFFLVVDQVLGYGMQFLLKLATS